MLHQIVEMLYYGRLPSYKLINQSQKNVFALVKISVEYLGRGGGSSGVTHAGGFLTCGITIAWRSLGEFHFSTGRGWDAGQGMAADVSPCPPPRGFHPLVPPQ